MDCVELDVDIVPYSWVIGGLMFSEVGSEVCADEFPLKTVIVIPFREDPHVGENGRANSGVVSVVEAADCPID